MKPSLNIRGHTQRMEDPHTFVVVAPGMDFCGHYNSDYGHCGQTREAHDKFKEED